MLVPVPVVVRLQGFSRQALARGGAGSARLRRLLSRGVGGFGCAASFGPFSRDGGRVGQRGARASVGSGRSGPGAVSTCGSGAGGVWFGGRALSTTFFPSSFPVPLFLGFSGAPGYLFCLFSGYSF